MEYNYKLILLPFLHMLFLEPTHGQGLISPFFMFCNYDLKSGDQSDLESGDIALSLSIEGDPDFYIPDSIYTMTITSSQDFDGFQINSVFSMGPNMTKASHMNVLPFFGGRPYMGDSVPNPEKKRFLCSRHVHAHFGDRPQHELTFRWLAPPKGTGCISFKATATREQQILFNSITIFHLCEQGTKMDLSAIHDEGLVLRDDFESSRKFDPQLWSDSEGISLSEECGVIAHGKAAVACGSSGTRELVTTALNLTTASVLQFTAGSCGPIKTDQAVHVIYGTDDCNNFTEIQTVSVPRLKQPQTHIVHLPVKARKSNICIKWAEPLPSGSADFDGCWAIDNVAIVNLVDPPTSFEDGFDPMDPSDWLFFSGAKLQHQCHSDEKAMIFDSQETSTKFVTTRDINLKAGVDQHSYLLREDFEHRNNFDGWPMDGGGPAVGCDLLDESYHISFNGNQKTRRLCTPYTDLSDAGSVSFDFTFGDEQCSEGLQDTATVFVYVEDKDGHTSSVSALLAKAHKNPKEVSLALLRKSQMPNARICWTQKSHRGTDWDVWVIDNIQVLRVLPDVPEHFIQFELNMNCGQPTGNTSVSLEYSTSHGTHWAPLYEECTDLLCYARSDDSLATFDSQQFQIWQRVSLPLPHSAMARYTRFRWSQKSNTNSTWAIDNVYIGNCTKACNNHGKCTKTGCICDPSFSGSTCGEPDLPFPPVLIENFSTGRTLHSFSDIHGADSLSYTCGIVATGKALLFSSDGVRKLETRDLNTQEARYLQYSIRMGSDSMVGDCPPPDDPQEVVLLHYTCDGGVSWHQLREMSIADYREPIMMSVPLPAEAQDVMCRLRWWQPIHSGPGHDVWAIDDISITNTMYNTVDLGFDTLEGAQHAVDVHLGMVDPYCGRQNVLSFTDPYQEDEFRYLETNSMRIGPSYMIQFDLVMGCDYLFMSHLDNKLYLEYSTNHGMTWDLVRIGCWPPRMCEEYHGATVYYPSEFQRWRRVAMALPQHTWSSSTRFRLRQPFWSFSDSWAIDNLYIGLQCPAMCNGHGYCKQAQCRCDEGYSGISCTPSTPLPSHMKTDFSLMSQLHHDWLFVLGGEMAGANQGCGIMLSGESLFFFQGGPRLLMSRDLNTTGAQFLEFYVQLGGENDIQCSGIESREENVLVQYSQNGGVTWGTLKELQGPDYVRPSLVHLALPEAALGDSVRLRWWQPSHSGPNTDQWAIDQVQVGRYEQMRHLEDNFEVKDQASPVYHDLWQIITDPMYVPYCGSRDDALMFGNQPNDKIAMTKDLLLKPGDTIQFWINVGCSKSFSAENPVLLEYSHDAGMSWSLLDPPCFLSNLCHNKFSHGSIYYTGQYGEWEQVVIPISQKVASERVNFRWWQKGGSLSSFALNDIYIGPPCPDMCGGHGMCVQGECHCHEGFGGDSCLPQNTQPLGMIDRFEDTNLPSALWGSIHGAYLGMGCGVIGSGNSLYFDGEGPREAKTIPLNTTNIKMLQFTLRIGDKDNRNGCSLPKGRMESIIVDYSHDNGIHWEVLKTLDPELYMDKPHVVNLPLPPDAKTESTELRWWQPLLLDSSRAEWAIDDVIIAVNDTSKAGFQENFNPMKSEVWYMAMNAVPRITCQSQDNALEFSKNGQMRYAETWDYHVTQASFLQFYIAMGCSGTYSTLYSVMLEYSIDMGRHWSSVMEECLPPKPDCAGYHLSSSFSSQAHANWTRVTLYLPPAAVSPTTRFRWLQQTVTLRGNVWALDNIYLGDGCPWMCSGHGYCDNSVCVCDPGYHGIFCVPSTPLPMTLRDDFDSGGLRHDNWPEVYGGEVTNICGLLVHGNTLTFYKDNLRMAVTRDLDVSMATFIQFSFRYGCTSGIRSWPREHTVILQYSTNGGIIWNLMEDLHTLPDPGNRYLNIPLPALSRTNATRFRFWQPKHAGHMKSVWSIDDVFVGGSVMNPDTLVAIMDSPPNPEDWLFWPSGSIDQYCSFNIRADTLLTNPVAMVFRKGSGEHSLTTRDLTINDMSVIQFEINVGCADQVSKDYPVRLEFSADGGKTWHLVVPPCASESMTCVQGARGDPTLYYAGTTKFWQRVVVPLGNVQMCGTARFRWYQGFISSAGRSESVPVWAIRNIYIGMQCQDQCNGHGACMYGMLCQCDDRYGGDLCQQVRTNPRFLKEDFDDSQLSLLPSKWHLVSGAETTVKCGTLAHGRSLHFFGHGVRMAMTVDLDLTTAMILQFFLRAGCMAKARAQMSLPIYVQYSKDGGISWYTLQQFVFGTHDNTPQYVAMEIPHKMRGLAVRVRWWQPAKIDGMFLEEWAIDQIYIGGDTTGRMVIADDLSEPNADNWLMHPGAVIESACGLATNALHFAGPGDARYAVTSDVTVTEATYMQFSISIGCSANSKCYGIHLEYSTDFGKSWHMLEKECKTTDTDCNSYNGESVFMSDVYSGWNSVTLALPYYTRTKATRFRFMQYPPIAFSDTWAISSLYIGDECVCSCGGHGLCVEGTCQCKEGWGGDTCTDPTPPLPSLLADPFTDGPSPSLWMTVNGAEVTTQCGVLSSGPALHFKGECTRLLISTDLDLRQAIYIHFNFRFGCLVPPLARSEGVILDYSTNGGKTWSRIIELYYDQYGKGSYVMIDLPTEAKENGVRLRFWQPHHPTSADSDWAIDNIVIGGKDANLLQIQDTFSDAPVQDIWLQQDNIKQSHYCGSNDAVQGIPKPNENVTLMTSDLDIDKGYIIQFSISVGCNASWDASISPVHLQYSVDYGMSWHYLVDECLPYMPHCDGRADTPSIYYSTQGWRTVTIYLKGPSVSKSTRFRWCQPLMLLSVEAYKQHWALDDVYIGPACEALCHGRGRCVYPFCRCDPGYGGRLCEESKPLPVYLKDTFNSPTLDNDKWGLVQGGHIAKGCTVLVESTALHLGGSGHREVVTVDLDLRNARFVQYYALIGGPDSTRMECGTPKSRIESILLQYSVDGGTTWNLLHLLDYQSYWIYPHKDYIHLPPAARTQHTRIRWWQPRTHAARNLAVGWTLDDVFVGGNAINPSQMLETFDGPDLSTVEFFPGGAVTAGICGKKDNVMAWPKDVQYKSLITQQMIIQENYTLQFKIVVGCGDDAIQECGRNYPILLEYNKDPSTDVWELIYPRCVLNSHETNMECLPYNFMAGSIYSIDSHQEWQRVTMALPQKVFSSQTRLRWIQESSVDRGSSWALDDVYIGEQCPQMCRGRGECIQGKCVCDVGFEGESCEPGRLPLRLSDGFEGGISPAYWANVIGGDLGMGCGPLSPSAHGKNLYFSGCGTRQAITAEIDTSKATKVMFVIKIGSGLQTSTCNIDLGKGPGNGMVVLQYSPNKGIDWHLIATLAPGEFLIARKVGFSIPIEGRSRGTQFRWWQPEHQGSGKDQWAIDDVEIITTQQDQRLKTRHYPKSQLSNNVHYRL